MKIRHTLAVRALALGVVFSASQQAAGQRLNLEAEYSVLDDRTARDKYGKEISQQFYVIPVTVANKDERKVSLQFVRFKGADAGQTVGTIPLETVIQIYEKKRVKGKRARLQQILAVTALVFPTADFFFKNPAARNTFSRSLNVYNAGRTGAFDIFPDYLQTYLQMLRGNRIFTKNFELAPNSSDTVDVFVLKQELPATGTASPVTVKKLLGRVDVFSFAAKSDEVDVVRTQ